MKYHIKKGLYGRRFPLGRHDSQPVYTTREVTFTDEDFIEECKKYCQNTRALEQYFDFRVPEESGYWMFRVRKDYVKIEE